MEKQKVLSKLMWDLQSFLSVLDSENLSYIAQAQKKSISELVSSLQTQEAPVEDAEYVIMSCPSSSSTSIQAARDSNIWTSDTVAQTPHCPAGGSQAPAGDGEEDEDTYEEAQPFKADSTSQLEQAESENSYYESYGEDNEDDDDDDEEHMKDRAHYIQWSSSQPCLRPPPESRLCGYLWRRKWLGQWTKQLFIIRNHFLLCYKCARDLLPHLQLSLRGCQLVYKLKSNRKIPHQLKLLLLGADTLVLGYSSFQQADEWRRVIEELSIGEDNQSTSSEPPLWSHRSSALLTHTKQQEPSHQHKNQGVVSVLMNCQWQSLLCQVETGILKMFAEEAEEDETRWIRARSPQYTLQLRGCEVKAVTDSERPHRITLSVLGEQLAVLEVSSVDEKRRWTHLLKDAASCCHDGKTQQNMHISGHTLNTYMDQPFHATSVAPLPQPVYSNTSVLEHMLQSSQDTAMSYTNTNFSSHNRKWSEVAPRGVQKLELTGKKGVTMRAGSEANLLSATNKNKRSSFRQSLTVCSERAQASLLNPLLRRTASVKTSLRRAPSTFFIEHGKVFQRKKEWETKAAA